MHCRLVYMALLVAPALTVGFARAQTPSPEALLQQAQRAASAGESRQAADLASQAIEQNPRLADGYYLRGRERFRLGDVEGSVADFEEYLRLHPQRRASLWERGISLYYAGKFEEGARQFALYQTYDDSDVENAVWRFLCVARHAGVEKARQEMLPIERDARVPMMQIYELYRGKASVDDVMRAAQGEARSEAARNAQLFYAHLYIGLYHEALGDEAAAKEHVAKAATELRISHYMGDVARVHVKLRQAGRNESP